MSKYGATLNIQVSNCASRKKNTTNNNHIDEFVDKIQKEMEEHEKENKSRNQSIFSSMYGTHTFAGDGVCDTWCE